MLLSPDLRLVERDPALPGLAILLDATRLSAWVTELLGRPVRVRRRYLRYKHGTSCVLYADADGLPLLISALRPAWPEKHQKLIERAGAAVLGQDPARGALIATPSADRHLRALAPLLDPLRRADALHRLGLGSEVEAAEPPRLLRYKPHRRFVGLCTATDGRPLLLRLYTRGQARAAATRLSELRSTPGVPTPRLLGRDFRRDALAVEYLPGQPVEYGTAGSYERAGHALGQVHSLRGLRLQRRSTAEEIRAVRAATRQLGVLLPHLAEDANHLGAEIAQRLHRLPPVARPAHGDFSADQAIEGPTGQISLIDLDAACIADPAADLGSAAAALLRDAALGHLTTQECAHRRQALQEGYAVTAGALDPRRLAAHTAAQLLRRTYEPFRLAQTAHWDTAAEELLHAAADTLGAATGVNC